MTRKLALWLWVSFAIFEVFLAVWSLVDALRGMPPFIIERSAWFDAANHFWRAMAGLAFLYVFTHRCPEAK